MENENQFDITQLNEGAWESLKYYGAKAGRFEKGGSMWGASKRGKQAAEQIQKVLADNANQLIKNMRSRLPKGFPNNKINEEFVIGANQYLNTYNFIVQSHANGTLPTIAANEVIKNLRIVLKHDLDYELSSMYQMVKEGYESKDVITTGNTDSTTIKTLKSNKLPLALAAIGTALGPWHFLSQFDWAKELIEKGGEGLDEVVQNLGTIGNGEGITQFLQRFGNIDLGPNASVANFKAAMTKLGGGDINRGFDAISPALAHPEGIDRLKEVIAQNPNATMAEIFKQNELEMTSGKGGSWFETIKDANVGAKIKSSFISWLPKKLATLGLQWFGNTVAQGVGIGALTAAALLKGARMYGLKHSRAAVLNKILSELNLVDASQVKVKPVAQADNPAITDPDGDIDGDGIPNSMDAEDFDDEEEPELKSRVDRINGGGSNNAHPQGQQDSAKNTAVNGIQSNGTNNTINAQGANFVGDGNTGTIVGSNNTGTVIGANNSGTINLNQNIIIVGKKMKELNQLVDAGIITKEKADEVRANAKQAAGKVKKAQAAKGTPQEQALSKEAEEALEFLDDNIDTAKEEAGVETSGQPQVQPTATTQAGMREEEKPVVLEILKTAKNIQKYPALAGEGQTMAAKAHQVLENKRDVQTFYTEYKQFVSDVKNITRGRMPKVDAEVESHLESVELFSNTTQTAQAAPSADVSESMNEIIAEISPIIEQHVKDIHKNDMSKLPMAKNDFFDTIEELAEYGATAEASIVDALQGYTSNTAQRKVWLANKEAFIKLVALVASGEKLPYTKVNPSAPSLEITNPENVDGGTPDGSDTYISQIAKSYPHDNFSAEEEAQTDTMVEVLMRLEEKLSAMPLTEDDKKQLAAIKTNFFRFGDAPTFEEYHDALVEAEIEYEELIKTVEARGEGEESVEAGEESVEAGEPTQREINANKIERTKQLFYDRLADKETGKRPKAGEPENTSIAYKLRPFRKIMANSPKEVTDHILETYVKLGMVLKDSELSPIHEKSRVFRTRVMYAGKGENKRTFDVYQNEFNKYLEDVSAKLKSKPHLIAKFNDYGFDLEVPTKVARQAVQKPYAEDARNIIGLAKKIASSGEDGLSDEENQLKANFPEKLEKALSDIENGVEPKVRTGGSKEAKPVTEFEDFPWTVELKTQKGRGKLLPDGTKDLMANYQKVLARRIAKRKAEGRDDFTEDELAYMKTYPRHYEANKDLPDNEHINLNLTETEAAKLNVLFDRLNNMLKNAPLTDEQRQLTLEKRDVVSKILRGELPFDDLVHKDVYLLKKKNKKASKQPKAPNQVVTPSGNAVVKPEAPKQVVTPSGNAVVKPKAPKQVVTTPSTPDNPLSPNDPRVQDFIQNLIKNDDLEKLGKIIGNINKLKKVTSRANGELYFNDESIAAINTEFERIKALNAELEVTDGEDDTLDVNSGGNPEITTAALMNLDGKKNGRTEVIKKLGQRLENALSREGSSIEDIDAEYKNGLNIINNLSLDGGNRKNAFLLKKDTAIKEYTEIYDKILKAKNKGLTSVDAISNSPSEPQISRKDMDKKRKEAIAKVKSATDLDMLKLAGDELLSLATKTKLGREKFEDIIKQKEAELAVNLSVDPTDGKGEIKPVDPVKKPNKVEKPVQPELDFNGGGGVDPTITPKPEVVNNDADWAYPEGASDAVKAAIDKVRTLTDKKDMVRLLSTLPSQEEKKLFQPFTGKRAAEVAAQEKAAQEKAAQENKEKELTNNQSLPEKKRKGDTVDYERYPEKVDYDPSKLRENSKKYRESLPSEIRGNLKDLLKLRRYISSDDSVSIDNVVSKKIVAELDRIQQSKNPLQELIEFKAYINGMPDYFANTIKLDGLTGEYFKTKMKNVLDNDSTIVKSDNTPIPQYSIELREGKNASKNTNVLGELITDPIEKFNAKIDEIIATLEKGGPKYTTTNVSTVEKGEVITGDVDTKSDVTFDFHFRQELTLLAKDVARVYSYAWLTYLRDEEAPKLGNYITDMAKVAQEQKVLKVKKITGDSDSKAA